MNEEQSEKLLNILGKINQNLEVEQQKELKDLKEELRIIKARLDKFIDNVDLKTYEIDYLKEIDTKFTTSLVMRKRIFERNELKKRI